MIEILHSETVLGTINGFCTLDRLLKKLPLSEHSGRRSSILEKPLNSEVYRFL